MPQMVYLLLATPQNTYLVVRAFVDPNLIAPLLRRSRSLASLLYDIKPTDPITYLLASLALLIAAVAAMVPVHRASQVDPADCLRSE